MPIKSKPDRRPVCYGIINGKEWHVDFTLVPKRWRAVAATRFQDDVQASMPGDRTRYVLIFHHATNTFQTERLRPNESMDIGDAVKLFLIPRGAANS